MPVPSSVSEWLRSLLLSDYIPNFIENSIEGMDRARELWEVELENVSLPNNNLFKDTWSNFLSFFLKSHLEIFASKESSYFEMLQLKAFCDHINENKTGYGKHFIKLTQ